MSQVLLEVNLKVGSTCKFPKSKVRWSLTLLTRCISDVSACIFEGLGYTRVYKRTVGSMYTKFNSYILLFIVYFYISLT